MYSSSMSAHTSRFLFPPSRYDKQRELERKRQEDADEAYVKQLFGEHGEGSKIKRIRMLDSVCLLQLLGKAFHPNKGGRSWTIDQHSYLPA